MYVDGTVARKNEKGAPTVSANGSVIGEPPLPKTLGRGGRNLNKRIENCRYVINECIDNID